jgi:hypothetical protein
MKSISTTAWIWAPLSDLDYDPLLHSRAMNLALFPDKTCMALPRLRPCASCVTNREK